MSDSDNFRDVVFVTSSTELWGAERSLLSIARGLRANGQVVGLVATAGELANQWQRERLGTVRAQRPKFTAARAISIILVAMRLQPKAIVCFDLRLLPALWLLQIALARSGIVVVVDLHDVLVSRRGSRRLRRFVEAADRVISVSEFAARQVSDIVATTVVYRPISTTELGGAAVARELPSDRAIHLGVIGRVDRQKRVHEAIQIASLCEIEVIVKVRGSASVHGNSAYVSELEGLGRELLPGKLHLEGTFDPSRVFDDIDILLMLNPSEPSGRVVAEAQALGIPVVCVAAGGAREFVRPGMAGLVFKPGDLDAAAKLIDRLCREGETYTEISHGSMLWAASEYDPQRQAARYATCMRIVDPAGSDDS